MNSDYQVTLSDVVMFIDEAPWLWRACWLTDDYLFEMMAMGGGVDMFMMEGVIPAEAGIQPEELTFQQELSVPEQIAQLTASIIRLERIWLEEPDFQQEIDVEVWYEFMDALYQELVDLYMQSD